MPIKIPAILITLAYDRSTRETAWYRLRDGVVPRSTRVGSQFLRSHTYGTFQVPVVVQGLYMALLSWAMPKVFLAPLKALKLRGKLRVRVVPLVETEALAAVSVHCALEREVAVPGVMGPRKVVPASFIRYKALAPWL